MIKQTIIILELIIFCLSVSGQVKKQDAGLKREVTLYNPYKPTLAESKKKSFLPDMNDTLKVRPSFSYDIKTEPYLPAYTISPIKAAALLPDPLPKLYKSYINIGMGNYITPLAELSVTNERSKKGTIGLYARHFSSNGKIELQNSKKVFAGYQDNDASVFGRKFYSKSLFEGSVDFAQRTRYAYGYNPAVTDYSPARKDIRMNYNNIGAKASLSSLTTDSARFFYKLDINYDFFYNARNLYQHSAGISGKMAKSFKGFYVGSGISYDYYKLSDSIITPPKYIASISPFIKKSTGQWNMKLGFQALIDKNIETSGKFHFYPDLNLGFTIVPSYVSFYAGLTGKMERNEPVKVIKENPYLLPNGSLFLLPNTDHTMIVFAGLKGNTGIGGNYVVSASYSLVNDMVFFSNVLSTTDFTYGQGNFFSKVVSDAEVLNIHGEMSGPVNDKLSFNAVANLYSYTLSEIDHAYNKPSWDGKIGLKYNLRDKILAGLEISAEGKRRQLVNGDLSIPVPLSVPEVSEMPAHFNLNLSAEYRYTKILSFWAKVNNISTSRYYEWTYYPSQRFLVMAGFTYSL
jgi:hypothetical protein